MGLLRARASCVSIAAYAAASGTAADRCAAAAGPLPYTLLARAQQAPDSWLLRFALPAPRRWLGEDTTLPTCVKVIHPNGTDEAGAPAHLEKSYSPVSHPAVEGSMELLVKGYPPRPGGGLGAYLCGLQVGEAMHAKVKADRLIHGSAVVAKRWAHIGLVGGGTGMAPLIQLARIVLEDPADATRVQVLSINRHEEDILMRAELDALAAAHPGRFRVAYSLTGRPPPAGWAGLTGRGSAEMIRAALPAPGTNAMVFVCGRDGFVESWAGPTARAPRKADGSKGAKIQGPLLGLLAASGYDASEVYKY